MVSHKSQVPFTVTMAQWCVSLWMRERGTYCALLVALWILITVECKGFPTLVPLGVEMALAVPWQRRHLSNRAETLHSWAF